MDNTNSLENDLQAKRCAIDAIDTRILELLNERAGYALEIRKAKAELGKALYDPAREAELVEELCAKNEGPLYNDHVREIYSAILKVMKEQPNHE